MNKKDTKLVGYNDLRFHCDPSIFGIKTTKEISPLEGIIGQDRAIEAINFGLEMTQKGYNIYICGVSGVGKTSTIQSILKNISSKREVPNDKCYVYNFKFPDSPIYLSIKAGKGKEFQKALDSLIEDLKISIPLVFEGDAYKLKTKTLISEFREKEEKIFFEFDEMAKKEGFTLVKVQSDHYLNPDIVPVIDGNPLVAEKIDQLIAEGKITREELKRLDKIYQELREKLDDIMADLKKANDELVKKLNEIDKEFVLPEVSSKIQNIKYKFNSPKVCKYLDELQEDIINHLNEFKDIEEADYEEDEKEGIIKQREDILKRYKVNLLVNNSDTQGAPVIFETNPTIKNLIGTIEHTQDSNGIHHTDFMRIKAGSIIKADGGYLVLNIRDLLHQEGSYDALKNILKYMKVEIEEQSPSLLSSNVHLKPEPIDITTKVILIGDSLNYDLLCDIDEDFERIFKVKAEFDDELEANEENIKKYAAFTAKICERENILPFNNLALASLVDYGIRYTESKNKITSKFGLINDIIREADYWARKNKSKVVDSKHVEKALEERAKRVSLLDEKIQESMKNGRLIFSTRGKEVGQVNGITVLVSGNYSFGCPIRVTASVAIGDDGIVNIEREVNLSGNCHDKGVLILEGYLRNKYHLPYPLTLSASICFEQSYNVIDGDSASATEVFALLSAIGEIPVRQDIGVTGSIDQKGRIQPIGGVNEKIEGFYNLCKMQGFTGEQGVIIPALNIQNLMLKEEVVSAVKKGIFKIFAINNVDEGMEILTGLKAGTLKKQKYTPSNSINALIYAKLEKMSKGMQKYIRF